MTRKLHDLVEIDATKLSETENALYISDGSTRAWVPKSQVEDNGDGTFSMPSWLARDKGFI